MPAASVMSAPARGQPGRGSPALCPEALFRWNEPEPRSQQHPLGSLRGLKPRNPAGQRFQRLVLSQLWFVVGKESTRSIVETIEPDQSEPDDHE